MMIPVMFAKIACNEGEVCYLYLHDLVAGGSFLHEHERYGLRGIQMPLLKSPETLGLGSLVCRRCIP